MLFIRSNQEKDYIITFNMHTENKLNAHMHKHKLSTRRLLFVTLFASIRPLAKELNG